MINDGLSAALLDSTEWFSPGVLKPPLVLSYPEYTAWRQAKLDAGAVELTAEEWAEICCD